MRKWDGRPTSVSIVAREVAMRESRALVNLATSHARPNLMGGASLSITYGIYREVVQVVHRLELAGRATFLTTSATSKGSQSGS